MDCWVSYTHLGFQLFSEKLLFSSNLDAGKGHLRLAHIWIFLPPSISHLRPTQSQIWSVRETGFLEPRNTKPPLSHSRIWTDRLYFIPSSVVVRGEGLIYWAVKFAIWQTASSRLKAKGGKREKRIFLFARCMARLTLVCQKWTRKKKRRGKRQ